MIWLTGLLALTALLGWLVATVLTLRAQLGWLRGTVARLLEVERDRQQAALDVEAPFGRRIRGLEMRIDALTRRVESVTMLKPSENRSS